MGGRGPRLGAYAPRVERVGEGTRDERALYGEFSAADGHAEEGSGGWRSRRAIKMKLPVRLQRQIDEIHAALMRHDTVWQLRTHKTPSSLMRLAVRLGMRKLRKCPDAEAVDALVLREQHSSRQVRGRLRRRNTKKLRERERARRSVREAVERAMSGDRECKP